MDDQFFDETITVTYLKRIKDNLEIPHVSLFNDSVAFGPWKQDGVTWWFVLVPILILAGLRRLDVRQGFAQHPLSWLPCRWG